MEKLTITKIIARAVCGYRSRLLGLLMTQLALILVCLAAGGCGQQHAYLKESPAATQASVFPASPAAEGPAVAAKAEYEMAPAMMAAHAPGQGAKAFRTFAPPAPPPPAAHNTEVYDRVEEGRVLDVVQNPLSTFSIDVDTASYANVRRFLNAGSLPPPDAVRIEELVNYFDYGYPQPQGDAPFVLSSELTDAPWQPGHKLLRVALQGRKVPEAQIPPANLVFLIDVSGSMEDDDRLPLLVKSFKMLVRQLRPQDKVAIVTYAGRAGLALPPTSGSETRKIDAVLDSLQADGSTNGGEGILLAYRIARENFVKSGNNRVILATDGDFNLGVSSDGDLERLIEQQRDGGIFLSLLGVGRGNYKDSRMQKLADRGNGNYAYIDSLLEAKKVLVREFGGTMLTIAKDVKLQLEFNPAQVKSYRLLGYENRALKSEDFVDDKKDAGELGSGQTVTALYELELADGAAPQRQDLTYQSTQVKPEAYSRDELAMIRCRYKAADGAASTEVVEKIAAAPVPLERASESTRFAAAVAEWGMLLRDSEYRGTGSFGRVLELARGSRGQDLHGDRAEFIRLVETAEVAGKKEVSTK